MRLIYFLGFLLFIFSCQDEPKSDLVIKNANIYAVDTVYTGDAMAIKDGVILQIDTWENIEKWIDENTEIVDAEGNFVMPGFIEGHGHYSGLAYSLINLNFLTSRSWEDIVSKL